jgi:regulator of protease activity HflC (stomatin/prohibitin superfamily)
MSASFQLLHSNEPIWSHVVHDYLLRERTPLIELMAWDADSTRMPCRMHSEYLRELFLNNDLASGRYGVDGRRILVPACNLYARYGIVPTHASIARSMCRSGLDLRSSALSTTAHGIVTSDFSHQRPPATRGTIVMNPITLLLSAVFVLAGVAAGSLVNIYLGPPLVVIGILVAMSVRVANVWEKFVILRVGKLQSVKGAGLFLIIPVLDNVVAIIDERIQTTAFNAEQALTKDTVPVNVDAIIFWHVSDAQKAALAITDYRQAIDRVAQTTLRELIGSSMLATLLSDRTAADAHLRDEIGGKTLEWGISVGSVEIRDVAIPVALQDAMSRQAQAEREKQARVILGSAEAAIASNFVDAARVYATQPGALQLRAMNIIYETTKERGATILMPTAMVDSLNPTLAVAIAGATVAGAPVASLKTAA